MQSDSPPDGSLQPEHAGERRPRSGSSPQEPGGEEAAGAGSAAGGTVLGGRTSSQRSPSQGLSVSHPESLRFSSSASAGGVGARLPKRAPGAPSPRTFSG